MNVSVIIKDYETMRAGSMHVVMRHAIVESAVCQRRPRLLLYASFQLSLL